MNLKLSRLMSLTLITLLLCTFSCQNEDPLNPAEENGKVIIRPISDEKVRLEIMTMANNSSSNPEGRTSMAPPGGVTLPSGYNYANAQEVIISGTSWVTYIAYSNTVNSSTSKEMVAIYYQNGVYKNYIFNKWWTIDHPNGMRYYNKYRVPENTSNYFQTLTIPSTNTKQTTRLYPPSECGQAVMNCFMNVYSNQGWGSVFFTLASIVAPEIAVGVMGGCMLSCALNGA